jgi:sugar phosphate isomerase/epimerase
MKIGMITDSLAALSLEELLGTAAELGIEQLEFAAGNWSQAPHLTLDRMLDSAQARQEFTGKLRGHGISISASTARAIRCIRARLASGIGRSRARRSRSPA